MVYCVLVRLLQRAHALCTTQLAIYALFSLNVSFKIWPTNESLRFSKHPHSEVEKQSVASQKMIEKKKKKSKMNWGNCVFCFFLLFTCLFYFFILYYFPFYPCLFMLSMRMRCVLVATLLTVLHFKWMYKSFVVGMEVVLKFLLFRFLNSCLLRTMLRRTTDHARN